jgi:6-phosphogluconolactonase/glucosamine-6-phosphate isomerase/deaminase
MSGGSGGQICVAVGKILQGHDLSGLMATMSDERFGEKGHKNENFSQLVSQGLSLPGATVYHPLTGDSLAVTTELFSTWLTDAHQRADHTIVTLGIGEDGHTSGVKPHSIAVNAEVAAVSFQGDDFSRITTTLPFLRTFDEAIVQSYGKPKHAIIRQLLGGKGAVDELPMYAIYDIPNVTIFSDYKEDTL